MLKYNRYTSFCKSRPQIIMNFIFNAFLKGIIFGDYLRLQKIFFTHLGENSATVVYKKAYDTSRGGRTLPHHSTPNQIQHSSSISQKRRKKKYYVNGCTQERFFLIL